MADGKMRCPNCGAAVPDPDRDGKVVCADCGGSFLWQDGKPRLAGVGELDKLCEDVTGLKATLDEIKARLPQPKVTDADDV